MTSGLQSSRSRILVDGEGASHSPWEANGADRIELIDQATRIGEIIDSLARHRVSGRLLRRKMVTSVRPVAHSPELGVIRWEVGDAIVVPPFDIELDGHNSLYQLRIEHAYQNCRTLVTNAPEHVARLQRRWHRRGHTAHDVYVRFLDPVSGAPVTGSVVDLSYSGLLAQIDAPLDLPAGRRVGPVEIVGTGRRPLVLHCTSRGTVPCEGGRKVLCRLEVAHGKSDLPRWSHLVDRSLHPNTRTGGMWSERIWRLFEECGYFHLSGREPARFSHLQRAFHSASRQLDHAPHIGFQAVWPIPETGEVYATAEVLKVYRGTWLGLHMAKKPGDLPTGESGRQVLRELNYRVYEHIQRDPSLAWFVTYIQTHPVWTRHAFHKLTARYEATGEACVARVRALAIPTEGHWRKEDKGDDDVTFTYATREQAEQLASRIERTRPRAYAEALDLVPERIHIDEIKRSWKRSRFERDRVILLAWREERPVAAAIMEIAADGLHLFNLLDVVRLYSLGTGGEALFVDLLDEAREWYRDQGKEMMVCLLEQGQRLDHESLAGVEDMGEADMCILAAHRVPAQLEHVHEITAPRTPRAKGRKQTARCRTPRKPR